MRWIAHHIDQPDLNSSEDLRSLVEKACAVVTLSSSIHDSGEKGIQRWMEIVFFFFLHQRSLLRQQMCAVIKAKGALTIY